MGLTVLADSLRDARWRDALRSLFITLADELPAFYAEAQVTRNHIWSGGSLGADSETERGISSASAPWLGIPPRPTWWSWFGAPYREFLTGLPANRCTSTANGLLLEAADKPAGWDELDSLGQWLPGDLFADPGPYPNRPEILQLKRATNIPDILVAPSVPEPVFPADVLRAASQVKCPRCGSGPGMPCKNADGVMPRFHTARLSEIIDRDREVSPWDLTPIE